MHTNWCRKLADRGFGIIGRVVIKLEFAREKGALFDKWSTSSNVNDFSSLRELMLLEDFKVLA